jgi:hypothetical protein
MQLQRSRNLLPRVNNAVSQGHLYFEYPDSNGNLRQIDVTEHYNIGSGIDEIEEMAEAILKTNAW